MSAPVLAYIVAVLALPAIVSVVLTRAALRRLPKRVLRRVTIQTRRARPRDPSPQG